MLKCFSSLCSKLVFLELNQVNTVLNPGPDCGVTRPQLSPAGYGEGVAQH